MFPAASESFKIAGRDHQYSIIIDYWQNRSSIYLKRFEVEVILYLEQWQSREDFEQHVGSSLYDRILAAMDLARDPPEIEFFENNGLISGMEEMAAIRNKGFQKDNAP